MRTRNLWIGLAGIALGAVVLLGLWVRNRPTLTPEARMSAAVVARQQVRVDQARAAWVMQPENTMRACRLLLRLTQLRNVQYMQTRGQVNDAELDDPLRYGPNTQEMEALIVHLEALALNDPALTQWQKIRHSALAGR